MSLDRRLSYRYAARNARRERGFTLIELMIVIAIVAIIVAIAVPSYNNYVMRTRRQLATACLVERAQFMERHYTTSRTYVGATPPACSSDITPFYTFGFATAQPTASTFILVATPTGGQASEPCGTLQLSNTGQRVPATGCW